MLTLVPTPIGNLRDITLRALDALREADVVACEDTRRVRALLSAHGIPAPALVRCDERVEERVAPGLVARALAGEEVVFASDAGHPGIADPGRALVREAVAAGCPLTVLPGPSSVPTALVASGLAGDGFAYLGWVPRRGSDRARLFERALGLALPIVLLESPRRLVETLRALPPEHPVAICRELTKLHEEVVRGSAAAVADELAAREPLGEAVLVLGAGEASGPDEAGAHAAVAALVAEGVRPRRAAELVAPLAGVSARRLYQAALGPVAPRPDGTVRSP